MKIFKTKIVGAHRTKVMNQGRLAARSGWERISPYIDCREEEAWYAGYDEEINNPRTLVHCTDCGVMTSGDVSVCPICESPNVRSNVGAGTMIMMTIGGHKRSFNN